MKFKNKLKLIQNRIIYTVAASLLLISIFVATIGYIYVLAEKDAYNSLHVRTSEIKEELNLQLSSDRENLRNMARMAESLCSGIAGFEVLAKNFEHIGFIDNIGILLPDGRLVTKIKTFEASELLIFDDEIKRGSYISSRITDVTTERSVVRIAEPLYNGDECLGILYGTIPLEELGNSLLQESNNGSRVLIVDSESGDIVIDTENSNIENITAFSQRKYYKNYTYDKLASGINEKKSGYTSFLSAYDSGRLYIHYAPLETADWSIMLAEPRGIVFAEANKTSIFASIIFTVAVVVIALYIFIIFKSERRSAILNLYASRIRKLLLGVNQQETAPIDALKHLAVFGSARSAFFIDTNGDDLNYIKPTYKGELLTGEERRYFINFLFNYAEISRTELNIEVSSFKIGVNSSLQEKVPEFYEFLRAHGIKNIKFAAIVQNASSQKSLIGVINSSAGSHVETLIEEIAICYSMAIYNKNYLIKTETIASTDALTGLSNRMAYKRDTEFFDVSTPENFACIYIDVNELHIINNTYGHAAGDTLLLFIASLLKEKFDFDGSHIYRIGGDEFLIFTENISEERLTALIKELEEETAKKKRYISVGMAYCRKNLDTETLVNDAEKQMYHAKALYYKNKETPETEENDDGTMTYISTGIDDIDLLLPIIEKHYHGVYRVNLTEDTSRPIIAPDYFRPAELEEKFTATFTRYVSEHVHSDHQRPMHNFIKYDVLKKQLLENSVPSMIYKKTNGEKFKVSVHKINNDPDLLDTVWIFEIAE